MQDIFTQITDYLWTQSWQIAALVVLLAIATSALRNRSAHIRYLLWLILLAKCLIPAFITIPLAILPAKEAPPAPLYQPAAVPAQTPAPMYSEPLYEPAAPLVYEMSEAKEPSIFAKLADVTLSQWLAVVWLTGIVLFLIIASSKAVRTNRWLKKHRIPLPAELAADIARLFENLGLRSPPNVWLIAKMSQPFVFGLIRGRIYLPANFTQIDTERGRRGVLGHELSHVLRFDAPVNVLQIIAQAIFWFHPFVWWANKRIRAEREKCCDEMALATLDAKAKDYSSAIVNTLLAEHKSRIPVPSLAIAGPVKNLEDRIKTIMAPNKRFYKRPGLIAIISALLIAAIAVPTTLALTHRQPPETADPQTEPAPQPSEPNSLTAEAEPEETLPVQFLSTGYIIEIKQGSAVYDYPAIQSPDKHTPVLNPDQLTELLELIETDPDARLLSRPKILAMDAQKGVIQTVSDSYISGYKEPDSGYGEPIEIKDTVTALSISVTAHLSANDIVRVEVELEDKKLIEFKQQFYKDKYPYQVPITTSKTVASAVAMESGQTIVLAGADNPDTRLLILLTCENLRPRQQSAMKLQALGREILIYAAEHNGKLPYRLDGRTIEGMDWFWFVQNVDYLGTGLTDAIPGTTLIAYDRALLQKEHHTNALYADGHVDLIGREKLNELLANPPVQPWRHAFEQVYRLEDNEVLKRIAPPFIPERVDYYETEHKGQASPVFGQPDYFQFCWDGKIVNSSLGFMSGESPLSHIIGHIFQVGRHNVEGPAELLELDVPGDWILRKDARQEDLLKALEPIVAAETGRDIRFVSRLVGREVIIATGRFSTSQERVDIFVDQIDSEQGAGGGGGTVPEFLEWVANRVDMPILDNTEPYGRNMSWDNHRDSSLARLKYTPEIYDPKLDTLLKNLADQTSLHFERTTRNIPKWFVVEGNTEPAPQYNPNIGGYGSFSPPPDATPGAPQTQFPNNSDKMAATYSPPQPPPEPNFTDFMNTFSPSEFVTHVYDVSVLLQRPFRYMIPGVPKPEAPETVPYTKERLLKEIQSTIDPNSWFDNGGEGTLSFYENKELIVRQTPHIHRKIDQFLRDTRRLANRHVSIEARFIRAPKDILEIAGLRLDDANTIDVEAGLSDPNALTEMSTLRKIKCSATTLSDAETDALIRATRSTRSAKTLIAPKATVLNGEAALLHAVKATPYVSPLHKTRDTFGPVAAQTPPSPPEDGPMNQIVRHRNYGTVLNVLPTLAPDNSYADMEVNITVSNLLGYQSVHTESLDSQGKVIRESTPFPRVAGLNVKGIVRVPAGRTLLITAPPEAVSHVYGSGPDDQWGPTADEHTAESAADQQVLLILMKPTIVLPEEVEPPRIAP